MSEVVTASVTEPEKPKRPTRWHLFSDSGSVRSWGGFDTHANAASYCSEHMKDAVISRIPGTDLARWLDEKAKLDAAVIEAAIVYRKAHADEDALDFHAFIDAVDALESWLAANPKPA